MSERLFDHSAEGLGHSTPFNTDERSYTLFRPLGSPHAVEKTGQMSFNDLRDTLSEAVSLVVSNTVAYTPTN